MTYVTIDYTYLNIAQSRMAVPLHFGRGGIINLIRNFEECKSGKVKTVKVLLKARFV